MAQLYSDQLDTASENVRDAARNAKEGTLETADNAQNKAAELGRRMQDKIDETRLDAAGKLRSAASALHQKADAIPNIPGSDTVAGWGHGAAARIESTADYIREHDTRRIGHELESIVRKRPAESLLAAAAVGFFLGRAFFRRGD